MNDISETSLDMNNNLKRSKKSKRAKARKSGRKNRQMPEEELAALLVNNGDSSIDETKTVEDEEATVENSFDQEEAPCPVDDADSNCADDESPIISQPSVNDESLINDQSSNNGDEQIVRIEHAGTPPIEENIDKESENRRSPSLERNVLRRRLKMKESREDSEEKCQVPSEECFDAGELRRIINEPIGGERSDQSCKADEGPNLENEKLNLDSEKLNLEKDDEPILKIEELTLENEELNPEDEGQDEELNLKIEEQDLKEEEPTLKDEENLKNEEPKKEQPKKEEPPSGKAKSKPAKFRGRISKKVLNFQHKGKILSSRGMNTRPFNEKEMFEFYETNSECSADESEPDSDEEEEENEAAPENQAEMMEEFLKFSRKSAGPRSNQGKSSLFYVLLRWLIMGALAYALNMFLKENKF